MGCSEEGQCEVWSAAFDMSVYVMPPGMKPRIEARRGKKSERIRRATQLEQ